VDGHLGGCHPPLQSVNAGVRALPPHAGAQIQKIPPSADRSISHTDVLCPHSYRGVSMWSMRLRTIRSNRGPEDAGLKERNSGIWSRSRQNRNTVSPHHHNNRKGRDTHNRATDFLHPLFWCSMMDRKVILKAIWHNGLKAHLMQSSECILRLRANLVRQPPLRVHPLRSRRGNDG
jgi:hypothetical protein